MEHVTSVIARRRYADCDALSGAFDPVSFPLVNSWWGVEAWIAVMPYR